MSQVRSFLRSHTPTSLRQIVRRFRETMGAKRSQLRQWLTHPRVFTVGTSDRLGAIFRYETHLSNDERIMLYALVRGIRPERVLEIGTFRGASAAIIAAALQDNGRGQIIGLDPQPCVTVPTARFFGRFELISARSPDGIPAARERAGGAFDLVHWDGINTYDQVRRDLEGLIPHLAKSSYVLINNPMHVGMHRAVCELIEQNDNWHDCGYLCRQVNSVESQPIAHQGLQLIRIDPSRTADPRPHVERAFARDGVQVSDRETELLNHDPWYCRAVKPCSWCQQAKSNSEESPQPDRVHVH